MQKVYSVRSFVCAFFILVGLLFQSCKKGETWWDADFSGPIAYSSVGLKNLLPDSILTTDPDSSLRIFYSQTVYDYKVDSLVDIPDTTLASDYIMPFGPYLVTSGQQLFGSSPAETFFDVDNASLVFAHIRSGTIKFEAENTVSQPMQFDYTLLNSDFAGSNFEISEEVPGGVIGNPGTITKYFDISGLKIDLTGLNGDKFNSIVTQSLVSMAQSAAAVNINSGEGLKIRITFTDIIPQYAKGYIGNTSLQFSDTLQFDFLKGMQASYFSLEDASVELTVANGFGMDLSISGVQMTSRNTQNNTSTNLSGSGVLSNYNLNRAVYTPFDPALPVQEKTKTFLLDNSNSNIKGFIENLPDEIIYNATAQINPLGNVSGNNDFVYYGYGLRTGLEMNIPLSFAASNLVLQDTVAATFAGSELDNLNSGVVTLHATNGFPFSAVVEAYLCDENYIISEQLFSAGSQIYEGYTDAANKVIAPRKSLLDIPLPADKVLKLKESKYIIFKITLNTVNAASSFVKIYDHYKMDLVLTADVNYSVNKE